MMNSKLGAIKIKEANNSEGEMRKNLLFEEIKIKSDLSKAPNSPRNSLKESLDSLTAARSEYKASVKKYTNIL